MTSQRAQSIGGLPTVHDGKPEMNSHVVQAHAAMTKFIDVYECSKGMKKSGGGFRDVDDNCAWCGKHDCENGCTT